MKKIIGLLLVLFCLTNLFAQVNGELTVENNQKFLRIWGTHAERGYAQGFLLGDNIMDVFENYLVAYTFSDNANFYNNAIQIVTNNFTFDERYVAEMEGLLLGMTDSGTNLFVETLNRDLNIDDLKLINSLIDLSGFFSRNENFQGKFGCSSLVSWGDSTLEDPILQGEIVISRLLDWATHPSLVANSIFVIHEPSEADEQKWVSFTYPSLIGGLTAINESKVYTELNMGNYADCDSSSFHSILLDTRTGIERSDYNQDSVCNAEDVWNSVNDQIHSSGFVILVANPTIEVNPAFYIEVNNLEIERRTIEDNITLHGNNIASTNHFRELYKPVYCSRYTSLSNSTSNDSTLTIEENFNILIDCCGLDSNMMTIQYIPSLNEIRWSNFGDFPAYQEDLFTYDLELLFNLGTQDISQENIPEYSNNISTFPNPFNPETTIKFSVENPKETKLEILNLKGQKVRSFSIVKQGEQSVVWSGKDDTGNKVSSGVYFINLSSKTSQDVKKILLLK